MAPKGALCHPLFTRSCRSCPVHLWLIARIHDQCVCRFGCVFLHRFEQIRTCKSTLLSKLFILSFAPSETCALEQWILNHINVKHSFWTGWLKHCLDPIGKLLSPMLSKKLAFCFRQFQIKFDSDVQKADGLFVFNDIFSQRGDWVRNRPSKARTRRGSKNWNMTTWIHENEKHITVKWLWQKV